MKIHPITIVVGVLLCLSVLLVSCSAPRAAATEQMAQEIEPPAIVQTPAPGEVQILCSGPEYQTDEQFFRSSGIGESTDISISQKKAATNARAEMAFSIETLLKGVVDDYAKSVEINNSEELIERYERKVIETTEKVLLGMVKVCEKTLKDENQRYTTFVAIEMPKTNVLSTVIDRITQDEVLKVDFNHKVFEDIFRERLDSLEKYRKGE